MNRTQSLFWLGTIFLSGLILAGTFLAPLLQEKNPAWSAFIYHLFSSVCHQKVERSFFWLDRPLAVCSRCLGFYAGFFISALSYPLWSRRLVRWLESRPSLILVAAIPLIVDATGGLLGLWWTPLGIRLASGILWAAFLPAFWFRALAELNRTKKSATDRKPLA
ncbi:MAG: Uncharacterized protein OP8BY_2131 [Candidatus Saccharicenans subterraneus]|uniref:DUF2085 domain-containing protein n=1 Tax=Candidatus Saccharicenans subterraneus TaxID=2508984 RepID=A0A3E2BMZ3_9BACT|nr:MAG: Uncharacterized protein OP8BY_2131 [Candidatus Saccharicenans subterraneum]